MANGTDVVVNMEPAKGLAPTSGLKKIGSEAEVGSGTPVVFKVCCMTACVEPQACHVPRRLWIVRFCNVRLDGFSSE